MNILPEIAKLLGVEINEEFKLQVAGQPIVRCKGEFCITNNNIIMRKENGDVWQPLETDAVYDILNGALEVVRKPWKPKRGELFYSYVGENWDIFKDRWLNVVDDLVFFKHGLVFKTEEEAIKKRPCLYEEYMGKKWQDR